MFDCRTDLAQAFVETNFEDLVIEGAPASLRYVSEREWDSAGADAPAPHNRDDGGGCEIPSSERWQGYERREFGIRGAAERPRASAQRDERSDRDDERSRNSRNRGERGGGRAWQEREDDGWRTSNADPDRRSTHAGSGFRRDRSRSPDRPYYSAHVGSAHLPRDGRPCRDERPRPKESRPAVDGGRVVAHADWICDGCGAVNFARRVECFQCVCCVHHVHRATHQPPSFDTDVCELRKPPPSRVASVSRNVLTVAHAS